MKRFLLNLALIFSLGFSAPIWGQNKNNYIKGYANYYFKEGDTLSFVKKVLLYKAFDKVIEAELKAMGRNAKLFFQQYNERFDARWETRLEELKKQYMGPESTMSQSEFARITRRKKFELRKNFSNLYKVIRTYSVERIWRSLKDSKSRNIRIKAKVDRYSLTRVYFAFIDSEDSNKFENLYLKINTHLYGMNWFDIGIEDPDLFTNSLVTSWKNWFEKKPTGNIQNYSFFPEDINPVVAESMGLKNLPAVLNRSLLLDLQLNLTKKNFDPLFKKFSLDIEIDYVLLSTINNQALAKGQVRLVDKTYKDIMFAKLPNLLANEIYRMPISEFLQLNKKIQKLKIADREIDFLFFHNNQLQSMFNFLKDLEKSGLEQKISYKLSKLKKQTAEVRIYYKGTWNGVERVIKPLLTKYLPTKLEYYPRKERVEIRMTNAAPIPSSDKQAEEQKTSIR